MDRADVERLAEQSLLRGLMNEPRAIAAVRGWLPRWRPHVSEPATLWVSQSCGLCRSTGEAVRLLAPHGVALRPAEEAPVRLTRMRFDLPSAPAGPGLHDRGVPALARALEENPAMYRRDRWLRLLLQAVDPGQFYICRRKSAVCCNSSHETLLRFIQPAILLQLQSLLI